MTAEKMYQSEFPFLLNSNLINSLEQVKHIVEAQDMLFDAVMDLEDKLNTDLEQGIQEHEFTEADIEAAFGQLEDHGIFMASHGIILDPQVAIDAGYADVLGLIERKVEKAYGALLHLCPVEYVAEVPAEQDQGADISKVSETDSMTSVLLEVIAVLIDMLEKSDPVEIAGAEEHCTRFKGSLSRLSDAVVALVNAEPGQYEDNVPGSVSGNMEDSTANTYISELLSQHISEVTELQAALRATPVELFNPKSKSLPGPFAAGRA